MAFIGRSMLWPYDENIITEKACIEVELTLLTKEEGGRHKPLLLDSDESRYMPHIVIGDPNQREATLDPITGHGNEEYLGVFIRPCGKIMYPGDTMNLIFDLMYYPGLKYEQVKPDATFTLRDGGLITGYGTVLSLIFEE
ncbi:MAG: hypothetical protein AAGD96_23945 [Chloroflexota bacterium]